MPMGSLSALLHGSVKTLNMVDRLSTDKSVIQHQILQDTSSSSFLGPLCGNTAFSASSNIGGYEHAAESPTPRSYHSHTDILSSEKVSHVSPSRILHDDFDTPASVSYREQAYNQCRRGSFSSSPSTTWDLSPFDEARNASCSEFCHRPAMSDLLNERNRGPRASRLNGKSKMTTYDHTDQQVLLSQFRDAKFFVIKSYSEDNVYKSIKYCVWASTKNGNKKLDAAYREAKTKEVACSVFLLFSVNFVQQSLSGFIYVFLAQPVEF
ncbi:unnamed protein product [Eruca vesicaria subsp. sativa]|uniref:YTH domain-containing family protein n=1 Tax=Eruca vesicaria subsp. sativa TaxID=29727 RepID=A0ABC8JWW0_ERUVS|nr:unnamed protein product [Eruca vesicaria subsp. sativa]